MTAKPDPLYAFEKLSEAVYELATGAGRVQERLFEAAIYFIQIRPVDIPDEDLRRMLVAIKDDLAFEEPKGKEGRIAATLQKTDDAAHRSLRSCSR